MGYYDIEGDLEVLGDYDIQGEDIMGLVKRQPARRPAPQQRQAAVAVKQHSPSKSFRLPLPIDTGAVAVVAGAAAVISLLPVQPFRATQLRLDPVAAPNFQITDIKVGRKSQLLGAGAIPATAFSALNPDCRVSFDTAQTSEPLVITVVNVSGAAARLTGVLLGETVE